MLLARQMFDFHDNAFGNSYDLVVKEDNWYGWNLMYSQHSSVALYTPEVPLSATRLIRQTDFNKLILERFGYWTGDDRIMYRNHVS